MFGSDIYTKSIPVHTALYEVGLSPGEEETEFFRSLISAAAEQKDSNSVHVKDIFHTAVDAGLGAGAGLIAAKTLGGLFGLPDTDRKALIGAGALGGALHAMGAIKMGSEEKEASMKKQAILEDLLLATVLFPYLLGSAGRSQGPKKAPVNELDTAALMSEYKRGIGQLQRERKLQPTPPVAGV